MMNLFEAFFAVMKQYTDYGVLGLTIVVQFYIGITVVRYLEKSRMETWERQNENQLETLETVRNMKDAINELTKAVEALA